MQESLSFIRRRISTAPDADDVLSITAPSQVSAISDGFEERETLYKSSEDEDEVKSKSSAMSDLITKKVALSTDRKSPAKSGSSNKDKAEKPGINMVDELLTQVDESDNGIKETGPSVFEKLAVRVKRHFTEDSSQAPVRKRIFTSYAIPKNCSSALQVPSINAAIKEMPLFKGTKKIEEKEFYEIQQKTSQNVQLLLLNCYKLSYATKRNQKLLTQKWSFDTYLIL